MQATLYSHRLKTVLQHTVVELGVTLSMDDEAASLSFAQNEAVILETASMLNIHVEIQKTDNATTVIFYK